MFAVYAGDKSKIGSPSAMYDMLQAAAARHPIDGNAEGSYVTMRSRSGIIFVSASWSCQIATRLACG